jgi:hypothetical protein
MYHPLCRFAVRCGRTGLCAAVAAVLAACVSRGGPDTGLTTGAVAAPTGFPARCGPDEVQVLLVGTFHFAGSSNDAVSTPLDVRTPARQAELEDLAARLSRWAPEQIAVEWPATFADSTAARYARYVASGGQSTSQNEVVQLGFRLARRLGHAAVHPIDHQMPIGNDSIGPLLARRPDLRARGDSVTAALEVRERASQQTNAERTLVGQLAAINGDAALHGGNSGSMFLWLEAGDGDNRAGPQLLARWYERNFHMAHNLTRILRPSTRRVLVLVGAGHVPPLRNILDESPRFCPVSPLPLLR